MRKISEKSGRIEFFCDQCFKKIFGAICLYCEIVDKDALEYEKSKHKESKRERKTRVSKEFTIDFDKKILEFAIKLLEYNKKLLIKDLVDLFEEEGMFSGLGKEVSFVSDLDGRKVYLHWAIRFTISLAKKWHERGEVFIGTRQIKGHPYEIYLPEEASKKIEDTANLMSDNPDLEIVKMPFGKHKGIDVKWIGENDPSYLRWLFKKCVLRDGVLKNAIDAQYLKLKLNGDGNE